MNGYTLCEYIQSDGNQYIDTGFKPNGNTKVVMDAQMNEYVSTYPCFFGVEGTNSYMFLDPSSSLDYYSYYYGTTSTNSTPINEDRFSRGIITTDKGVAVYHGQTVSLGDATFDTNLSMFLFGCNRNGTFFYKASMKLYSCKIYDNDTLVRDYIPCMNTEGVYGLYDNVNDVFYSSATDSGFTGKWTEQKCLNITPQEFRHRLMCTLKEDGLPIGTTFDFPYTGTVQEVTLPKGRYMLQCWGAQGTDSPNANGPGGSYKGTGSNGGYSEGVLSINKETVLYVFVGGRCGVSSEKDKIVNGGWNGGGGCIPLYTEGNWGVIYAAGQGGGATDIALVSSDMTYSNYMTNRSQESLLSRIIVAGGGGGGAANAYWDPSDPFSFNGGGVSPNNAQGGGIEGMSSSDFCKGTQSNAGEGGGFGFGGTNSFFAEGNAAGGGSGWYGGGTGITLLHIGGGSGFVNIAANAQYRPSGYTGLELESGQTIAGNTSFPSVDGGTETGHSGNGYARITAIGGSSGGGSSALPNGYTQVEYIQSSGSSWIDTGIYPNNTTKIQTKLNMTSVTGDVVIGHQGGETFSSDSIDWRIFNHSNNFYLDINSQRVNGGIWMNSISYNVEFGNNYLQNLDSGEIILSGTTESSFTHSVTIKVFKGVSKIASGMIFYLKIYDGGALVRDYVPAMRNSDGVYGLFDKVNNTFKSSDSGTNFTGA